MSFGDNGRNRINKLAAAVLTMPVMAMATLARAQEAATEAKPEWVPYGPDMIMGQPTPGGMNVQHQYSPIGEQAYALHHGLLWVMGLICLFVLALLIFVMVRFRKGANPVPSKTTHSTVLEVFWTGIPIMILLLIAVPSLKLLAAQYESPPKDALTVKVTGYQWYWGYTYPDNGGFEVISNMLPDDVAVAKGEPAQLAVDNRMVVPVGVPIRLQTTGADVIHSFAVPSLWFKIDAVPGRLNERTMFIEKPGIYYGQCSELCGARHGFMPIAVEAVPMERFKQWIAFQGGTMPEDVAAAAAAEAAAAEPADAPAAATPAA